jgi:hypothetical protein
MQYDDGDWKELRGRVDSLAGAVFLVAGGALTLSISVLLDLKESTPSIKCYAEDISRSWYALLASIILFVVLKMWLIVQSFMRGVMTPEKHNPTVKYTNTVGWFLGLSGLVSFVAGMYKLVSVAVGVANA